MDGLSAGEAAFCRITQMGLLRLLTNHHVMRDAVLSQAQAWNVCLELERDERTLFCSEPAGIERRWRDLSKKARSSGSLWTDCYLRAFGDLAGLTIATFDRTFAGSPQTGAVILE